jgi:CHAT domain-containing protein
VPVHAAGIYEGGSRECCADYVVSSYTPTLTALLRAQQTAPTFAPQEVSLLTVAVENSPGMPRLPCVAEEARVIAQITNARSVSCGSGGDTMSKAELVTSLESANMVHLACHGIQHRAEPHKSHFCLGSGELTVSELMEVDLKNSFFAFLSACETAKGDQKHADEVVHLAATMLFTGFKSVVATMWFV